MKKSQRLQEKKVDSELSLRELKIWSKWSERTKLINKKGIGTFGMNGNSEKWKLGKLLGKGDRMRKRKKVDLELSLRELKRLHINLP